MPVIRRKLSPQRRTASRVITIRKTSAPVFAPAPTAHLDEQRVKKLKAAAKYLDTSVWQVRKYIRDGVLPSFRIGNKLAVDCLDLDALIERLKSAAA